MKSTSKPWGYERLIEQNEHYVVKLIRYEPGLRTSLQHHEFKRETLYVVQGQIILELDGEGATLGTGRHVTIEPGQVHRVMGGRVHGGTVIECSTIELDDIIRHEDDFGRAP